MATKKNVKETVEVVENKEVKKAKKPAMQSSLYVEFGGNQVKLEEKAIIASVKKAWTAETGKKVGDIATMDLYVKPEEATVYYVINSEESGKVEL